MKPFRLWIYRRLTCWLPESRGNAFKCALLRWAGAVVGHNVRLYSSAMVVGNGSLIIGDDVHIGSGVFISAVSPVGVTVGSHVDIGPQTMILTGSHEIDAAGEHIGGKGTASAVTIGDGCWLGARSVLLPGVVLAEKTLCAAGSVVTHSVTECCCLVAGVPAGVKKHLQ